MYPAKPTIEKDGKSNVRIEKIVIVNDSLRTQLAK